ncbi:MAG: TSUP family transporter [Actinomycetota bacterium]
MNRSRAAWALSALATIVWLVAVSSAGMFGRIAGHWESTVTMLFGSFLAGSSPEGGGAVAFPVFTKALDVPGPIARTFGLSIQAVGMSMAVAAIVINRRAMHARSLQLAVPSAVVGFVLGITVLGRPDELFWPSTIGTPWVKATFSIVLATTSLMMLRHLRGDVDEVPWSRRLDGIVLVAAFAGGLLSSLTGTGANIAVFLVLVMIAGVRPHVALPTSIAVMAVVSVVGLLLLGLVDGALHVAVEGGRVVSVGGEPADLEAERADLLGLWLAAVPVVVWGAPLGSFCITLVRESTVVRFVAALAAIEVLTTVVLVEELRTEPALVAYLAVGLVALPGLLIALARIERQPERVSSGRAA